MYRTRREDLIAIEDETLFKQSNLLHDTSEKWETCLEIPGLSSFNIWAPWKNRQEAFIAIDRFLQDAKQQALIKIIKS